LEDVLKNLIAILLLAGCSRAGLTAETQSKGVSFPKPPGGRALGLLSAELDGVHGVQTDKPPAAIRPDPDLFARRLLRQYRPEGSLVAREIGRVEAFRLLLGGASDDFATPPQETYDSTSLLAMQKVSEEICKSLVAPNAWEHPGWKTILPSPPGAVETNIRFLAQRIIGIPTSRIDSTAIADLVDLTNKSKESGELTYTSYVPACVALSLDAEALLL
jgi:hypothetical protein